MTNARKTKAELELIAQLPATPNESIVEGYKAGERARLLSTNLVGNTPKELARQFEEVARLRPNIREPVHHASINIKPGEHLETHRWIAVGMSYLKEMGYENCPFMIAQHREKEHEHIHVLTSEIDFNGKVVSSSFQRKRARKWANGMEEKYKLTPTAERASEKGLSRVEIEQALKTKSPPPKLILQASIKDAIIKNPETPAFIDALHRQNISIAVRTNPEKEIIGVSFAYAGKRFKGSSLGTDFSWKGLQENGLGYESQRDDAKLEAASRRALAASQSTRSKSELGRNDNALESGIIDSARFSSDERRRDQITRAATNGSEIGVEGGINKPAAQPISAAATDTESIAQTGDAESQGRGSGKFRRLGQFDSGEIETARRNDEESKQSAFTETIAEIVSSLESGWYEYAADQASSFQELERQTELLYQSLGGTFQPVSDQRAEEPTDSLELAILDQQRAGNAVVDADRGNNNHAVLLDSQTNGVFSQSDLANNAGAGNVDCVRAGNLLRADDTRNDNCSSNSLQLGADDHARSEKSVSGKVGLSDKLRASLNDAESLANKGLGICEEIDRKAQEEEEVNLKIMEEIIPFEI